MYNIIYKILKPIVLTFYKIKNKLQSKKTSKNNALASSSFIIVDKDKEKETNVLDVDLLDDNASDKNKKKVRQYTKIAVTFILIMAFLWISWSYVLSSYCVVVLGTTEVLQDLSKDVCNSIVAVMLGYFLKAYFESYSQAKHEIDIMQKSQVLSNENNDEQAVG